jgi:hypothetical protein
VFAAINSFLTGTVSSGLNAAFNYVAFLLKDNSSNTGNNSTFTDSGQGATITRNGNPTQGNFTPFSQRGWSNYFYGNGAITPAAGITTAMGGGFAGSRHTIECFVYPTFYPAGWANNYGACLIGANPAVAANGRWTFALASNAGGNANLSFQWTIGTGTADSLDSTGYVVPINQWSHVAVTIDATTPASTIVSLFVNGSQVATRSDANFTTQTTYYGTPSIGTAVNQFANSYYGYLSNFRILTGTVLYTGSYTVPTSLLTAIANTKLLTCQSYNFTDKSSLDLTMSISGTPKVVPFSPFSSGVASSGSSVYYDGTGDYLTNTSSNSNYCVGTGDWTVEGFVYPFAYGGSTVGADMFAVTNVTNGTGGGNANGFHINIGENIDRFRLISNASGTWTDNLVAGAGNGPPLYSWSHMACSRKGDTFSIFKDGKRVATTTGYSGYKFSTTPNNYSVGVGGGPYLDTNRVANWGLNNYTIEFWTYIYGYGQDFIFNANDGSNRLQVLMLGNGSLVLHQPGDLNFGGNQGNWTLQGWNHVAICRSSQSIAAWVNGVRLSNPQANTYQPNTATFQIGPRNGGNNRCLIGPVRINNSTSIYNPASATIGLPGATFGGVGGDIILCGQYASATTDGTGATLTAVNGATAIPFGANGTAVNSAAPNAVSGRFYDGGTTRDFQGYMHGVRFSNSAVYDPTLTTCTVPTSPVSGGLFSLPGSGASIYDITGVNNLETVGSVQVSTAQFKSGTSSTYFPSSGSYLYAPIGNNQMLLFGKSDFTVEAWINPNGVSGSQYIASVWGIVAQSDNTFSSWQFRLNNANLEAVFNDGSTTTTFTGTGSGVTASVWQHVALVRSGNTMYMWLDGRSVGTASYSSTLNSPASAFVIGMQLPGNNQYLGYMDELRITRQALYTIPFFPRSAAFATS